MGVPMDLHSFCCLSRWCPKVVMCASSVHCWRIASFALVLSKVITLHYVDRRCMSMMMMVLFAKTKYSLLSSSTYFSLTYSTIQLTSVSFSAYCSLYSAFLAFFDSCGLIFRTVWMMMWWLHTWSLVLVSYWLLPKLLLFLSYSRLCEGRVPRTCVFLPMILSLRQVTILAIFSVIIFIVLVVGCPIILSRAFSAMIDHTISRLDATDTEEKFILICCI